MASSTLLSGWVSELLDGAFYEHNVVVSFGVF